MLVGRLVVVGSESVVSAVSCPTTVAIVITLGLVASVTRIIVNVTRLGIIMSRARVLVWVSRESFYCVYSG